MDYFTGRTMFMLNEEFDKAKFELAIEDFALQMAVNLIAGLVAKCEFITMKNGKTVCEEEYYLWNYEPNCNQAKAAFISELINKMIIRNKALVIESGGQLIIADSFERKKYAFRPNLYFNIQIDDLTLSRTYSEEDVLYFPYANEELRAQLSSVLYGYEKLMSLSVEKYKRSGNRKAVIELPSTVSGTKDEQQKQNEHFNELLKTFMSSNKDSAIGMPAGMKYNEISSSGNQKSPGEISDIIHLIDESFGRVAQAVRLPKSLLMGDVANLDSALEEALTVCINPLVNILAPEINRKRYGKSGFKNGHKLAICTNQIKHHDILDAAVNADKLIQSSLYNVDEVRALLGSTELNTWWSKRYVMTKNYTSTELLDDGEGGEKNV